MTLTIPPDYAQVLLPLRHSSLLRSAAVTWAVNIGDFDADYAAAATRVFTDFSTTIGGSLSDNVTMGPIILRVGQDGGDPVTFEGTATAVGGNSSDMPPSNVALIVKKLTSRGGRRGRGRIFLPWAVAESSVDEIGNIESGTVGDINGVLLGWHTGSEASVGGHAAPIYLLHNTGGHTTPGNPTHVTGLFAESVVGTQRRRIVR